MISLIGLIRFPSSLLAKVEVVAADPREQKAPVAVLVAVRGGDPRARAARVVAAVTAERERGDQI